MEKNDCVFILTSNTPIVRLLVAGITHIGAALLAGTTLTVTSVCTLWVSALLTGWSLTETFSVYVFALPRRDLLVDNMPVEAFMANKSESVMNK